MYDFRISCIYDNNYSKGLKMRASFCGGPTNGKDKRILSDSGRYIYQELYAHSNYSGTQYPLYYWRTASQIEIDFVLGDHEVAIEVKSTKNATPRHTKGLKSFAEEFRVKKKIREVQLVNFRRIFFVRFQ